jgi:hypothetical protein
VASVEIQVKLLFVQLFNHSIMYVRGVIIGYIDVYNMTSQLARHFPHEAETMTFDRVS